MPALQRPMARWSHWVGCTLPRAEQNLGYSDLAIANSMLYYCQEQNTYPLAMDLCHDDALQRWLVPHLLQTFVDADLAHKES